MTNTKVKFLCLCIVFLIVSITPASATIIGHLTGNNNSASPLQNKEGLKQSIQNDQNQMDQLTEEINNDTEDINVKLEKLKDTPKWRIFRLIKIVLDMEDTSKSIKHKIDRLDTLTKNFVNKENLLDSNYTNDSSSGDEMIDAQNMAKELQSNLNIYFEVTGCGGNYNVGDIVQYRDNNGYYRYVAINNTTENSITLEGKDHQLLTLTKVTANNRIVYKLNPETPINSYSIIDNAYNIQLGEIQQQKDDAQTKKDQADKTHKTGGKMALAGFSLDMLSLILMGICVASFFLVAKGSPCPVILLVTVIFTAVSAAALGVTGGTFFILSEQQSNKAKELLDAVDDDLKDLNNFLGTGSNLYVPVANEMFLNTTTNKTLEGIFNATDADGKVVDANVVTAPEHGNMTINGTKFVYVPDRDYVSNDTFTYKVKDETGLISNIATVNIQIKENIIAGNMSLNATLNEVLEGVFNVTGADGGVLNAIVVSAPSHGNLTINGTKFVYTPANDYEGDDTFSYRLKDNTSSLSNIATVNIQITALNTLRNNHLTKDGGTFLNI